MSDIREKAAGNRNWVERLLHHVPGFRGYLGKEERRETDKLLRTQLATRLTQLSRRLDPIMRDLTDSGGLSAVGQVDRVKKAVGRLADKIEHAAYGYSGFFDVAKVREAELDRLYEFDVALVERVHALEDVINRLPSALMNPEGLRPTLQKVLGMAREFDEHIDRRSQAMTELRADDPSGR